MCAQLCAGGRRRVASPNTKLWFITWVIARPGRSPGSTYTVLYVPGDKTTTILLLIAEEAVPTFLIIVACTHHLPPPPNGTACIIIDAELYSYGGQGSSGRQRHRGKTIGVGEPYTYTQQHTRSYATAHTTHTAVRYVRIYLLPPLPLPLPP